MHLKNRFLAICFIISGFCNAQELVKDINNTPGTQPPYEAGYAQRCYSCGGKVYAYLIDATHGKELWVTDGSYQGTKLVKDIVAGTQDGVRGSTPVCLNNKLYFEGTKLWKTDGTEVGTEVVYNGATINLVRFGDRIAFTSENKLLTSDGTAANVIVVKTFSAADGTPTYQNTMRATSDRIYLITMNNDPLTGVQQNGAMWVSDGTTTTKLRGVAPNEISQASIVQGKFLFNSYDENGVSDLWVSDGTVSGTKLLLEEASLPPYDQMNRTVNGKHLVNKRFEGTWVTDGTDAGTVSILPDFTADDVREFKGKFYFLGRNGISAYHIRRTNSDFNGSIDLTPAVYNTALLGVVGEKLLVASGGVAGEDVELMMFDGVNDQPSIIKNINPGSKGSNARSFALLGNAAVFLADDGSHGMELWKSDATAEGTLLLKDVATNTESADIKEIYFRENKMYFLAYDGPPTDLGASRRLWVSDGTTAGTSLLNETNNYYGILFEGVGKYIVTDNPPGFSKTDITTGIRSTLFNATGIYQGLGATIPTKRLVVGDDVYANLSTTLPNQTSIGNELWRINAVKDEVVILKDINPGPGSSTTTIHVNGAPVNNKLVFGAFTGQDMEPWVTDGTQSGTVLLKDVNSSSSSFPYGFTPANGKVFFLATTTSNYLWMTDGTTDGTKMVKAPSGPNSHATSNFMGKLGTDKVVFGATTSGGNTELWISDGTDAGTKAIKTLNASQEVALKYFSPVGNTVYFVEDEKRLWITDGTETGTRKIDFETGGTLKPEIRASSNSVFYFHNNDKIWYTYGSTASTFALGPAMPVSELYITDKYVCFAQNDPAYGVELFRFPLPDASITGLEDVNESHVILHPNPADRVLFVKVASPSYVRILDINGREHLSKSITGSEGAIDVSSLVNGVYIVTIRDIEGTHHVRFLKH